MDRAKFFARSQQKKTIEVELADGEKIKVRKLSQEEVEHINKNYATPEKALAGYRYVVTRTALNDDGSRMFEDGDFDGLKAVDFDDLQSIANAVSEFSGVGKDPKKS